MSNREIVPHAPAAAADRHARAGIRSLAQHATGAAVLATLVGAAALAGAEAGTLLLSQDSRTQYVIALAQDASPPERTAARELQHYLGLVTGAEFAIVEPPQAGERPVIAVGPGAARRMAPDLVLQRTDAGGLGHDGIVLKTLGKHLLLTGAEGSRRGTLYAVYEFLEREAGVRWWTKDEEFVPTTATLAVPALDVRYAPPFLYREVFSWGMMPGEKHWGYDDSDQAAVDWPQHRFAARLRNNGHGTAMPASLGGCYMPLGFCHTFYPLLPPATYFGDHPEWYSEINGQRVGEKAQLCMTNDAMLAELARNVLARVRQQPQLGIVVLTMNDWGGNCQCARCQAMDTAEESPMGSLLYGVNKVAAAVETEFPEFLVATHAYLYARKPPKMLRPRDNVLIWYCVIERSAAQPIDSEMNRALQQDLQNWARVAPKLFIWDYTMNLPGPFAPHPNLHVFGPDFRTYRDSHAVGVFCESEANALTHAVEAKVYVMAHLLWDPAQDERLLIDDFLQGYYGKAAPALRDWYELLRAEAANVHLGWSRGPEASWLGLPAMNRGTELLQQAEAAVADDAVRRVRVRRARVALEHQWLQGYGLYRREAELSGKPFLGPADAAVAARELAGYVLGEIERTRDQAMTGTVELYMGVSYKDYMDRLTRVATLRPGPLPAEFAEVPRQRIVDMDETLASVFEYAGASVVADPKAANGMAMRVPKAEAPSWAVQAKTQSLGALTGFGRYRVYAVVRCDLQTDTGAAFVGGVWDARQRQGLGAVSFPIAKAAPPPPAAAIDANPEVRFATISSGAPVTDGEYHVYDFGLYDLPHPEISVWVGTTTGDIYVDRFLFVRE
jgi:hypothetical protein